MAAARSLELIIKGLLVAADATLITTGKVSERLESTMLMTLIRDVQGFNLTSDEKSLLKAIDGRTKYLHCYPLSDQPNGVIPGWSFNSEEKVTYTLLYDRLAEKLYHLIRDGWHSGQAARVLKVYLHRYEPENTPPPNLTFAVSATPNHHRVIVRTRPVSSVETDDR